ncbi:MAG: hypothetical protein KAT32_04765 [Candidatus Moranbacteria bacterium]|nr:hypothetical protein [Candidatus Moranbacteria bacterium]
MKNSFNNLDFRKNKKSQETNSKENVKISEKKVEKSSLVSIDKKSKKSKTENKVANKIENKKESQKISNKKSHTITTDNDSVGYFPPQRNLRAYSYDITMSIFLFLSAGGFFFLFQQSVNNENFDGIWAWLLPLFSISFFVVVLLIYAITVHVKKILLTTIFLSFLTSLVFALQFWHGVVIILSFLITYFSVHQMRKALFDSVKINVGNLVRLGISGIMFSVIFLMCSQYYWMVYEQSLLDLMPRFDKISVSEKVLNKFLKIKEGENSSKITVDEFLLMSMKGGNENQNIENSSENNLTDESESQQDESMINNFLKNVGIDGNNVKENFGEKVDDVKNISSEKVDEVVVNTMRKNLSKQLGQELNGDEYIADVFDNMMYEKVAGWFSRDKNGEEKEKKKISSLALILTFLLFVSALTLKAVLRPVLVLLAIGLFWILRMIGAIKITSVKRETEMIISQSSV